MGLSRCGDKSAWALRVLVAANLLSGLCLITFGANLKRSSPPAVCMILLGAFNWAAAISGFLGSSRFSCCLDVFLALDGVNALLTIVLVAELVLNFEGVASAVDPRGTGKFDAWHIKRVLHAAQWLLAFFLLIQLAALVVALLMRFFIKPDNINDMDESAVARRDLAMRNLRVDVEIGAANASSTRGNAKFDKLMSKVQTKYENFAHGMKFKKSFFSMLW